MAEKKNPKSRKTVTVKDLSAKQGSRVRGGQGVIITRGAK
jgi:hypothetical protein